MARNCSGWFWLAFLCWWWSGAGVVAQVRPTSPGDAHWQDGFEQYGVNGDVRALATLPNGDILAGGCLYVAGRVTIQGIARWNGTEWLAMPGLFPASGVAPLLVNDIEVLPSGDVLIGGAFALTVGGPAVNVARWSGSSWAPLATGVAIPLEVTAIKVLPGGDIAVSGSFTDLGGHPAADYLARWDGTSWQPFGAGLNGGVNSLVLAPNGDLLIGGDFTDAGGLPDADGIARWDGVRWQAVGGGVATTTSRRGAINTIVVLATGDVVVGGSFTRAGGISASNVACWRAGRWESMGTGVTGRINRLIQLPNGELFAGGNIRVPQGAASNVVRWNGTEWLPFGSDRGWGLPSAMTLAYSPRYGLLVGWWGPVGISVGYWTGTDWSSFGTGLNGSVTALVQAPNGDVIVGGYFNNAGGNQAADYLARWDGTTWHPIGGGLNNPVHSLTWAPNGDLLVGGIFTDAGGNPAADQIARWDGATWHSLGPVAPTMDVRSIDAAPNGEVTIGGLAWSDTSSSVAQWNGTSWRRLAGLTNDVGGTWLGAGVFALQRLPNGELVAGGRFRLQATYCALARWDGSQWQPVGGGIMPAQRRSVVYALNWDPSRGLLVGGEFASVGGNVGLDNLACWDGSTWRAVGPDPRGTAFDFTVYDIAISSAGEVVIGGQYHSSPGMPAQGLILRGNGTMWRPLGSELNAAVLAVGVTAAGDIIAGGDFTTVGDGSKVTAYFGLYRTVLSTPNELAGPAPFTLAPNPATAQVRLEGARATTAEVYDALGRHLRTVPLTAGAATFDVGGLAPGVYVVRAGRRAQRLVVE